MQQLDRLQISESLEMVLEYAESKLTVMDGGETGKTLNAKKQEEYNRYKQALADVESVMVSVISMLYYIRPMDEYEVREEE
tara:strand:- start:58 stop:300 length:243 start_codon:yes stop_codon:yes gene_type:complete